MLCFGESLHEAIPLTRRLYAHVSMLAVACDLFCQRFTLALVFLSSSPLSTSCSRPTDRMDRARRTVAGDP